MEISEKHITSITEVILTKFKNVVVMLDVYVKTKNRNIDLIVSTVGLKDAIDEIIKDLKILNFRRQFDSLNRGKIAGIITFRLSRWNIINVNDDNLANDRIFIKFNYLIAYLVGLAYVQVDHKKIDQHIRGEIIYTLMRRHMNQETLGIVYDILKLYVK